jgi:hypothetical protein
MIRTRDKLITNQLLYQLSYKGEEKGACTPSIITSRVRKLGSRVTHIDVTTAGRCQSSERSVGEIKISTRNKRPTVVDSHDDRTATVSYSKSGPKWERTVCGSHRIGVEPFTICCGLTVIAITDSVIACSRAGSSKRG